MPLFVDGGQVAVPPISKSETLRSWFDKFPKLKDKSQEFICRKTKDVLSSNRLLYVAQREYGTVCSGETLLNLIGSDDATTCQIVVLHDAERQCVSLGHFDGSSVSLGVSAMISQLTDLLAFNGRSTNQKDSCFYAHIFGGFSDHSGYSEKLFRELLASFANSDKQIILETCSVCTLNTSYSESNIPFPIMYGVAVELSSFDMFPANFQYKGPDAIMRHARNFSGCSKMLPVYDFRNHCMYISPFTPNAFPFAESLLDLEDEDVLKYCSTSPHCEPPGFVETMKETVRFLLQNNENCEIFKDRRPLVYKIDAIGIWQLEK